MTWGSSTSTTCSKILSDTCSGEATLPMDKKQSDPRFVDGCVRDAQAELSRQVLSSSVARHLNDFFHDLQHGNVDNVNGALLHASGIGTLTIWATVRCCTQSAICSSATRQIHPSFHGAMLDALQWCALDNCNAFLQVSRHGHSEHLIDDFFVLVGFVDLASSPLTITTCGAITATNRSMMCFCESTSHVPAVRTEIQGQPPLVQRLRTLFHSPIQPSLARLRKTCSVRATDGVHKRNRS